MDQRHLNSYHLIQFLQQIFYSLLSDLSLILHRGLLIYYRPYFQFRNIKFIIYLKKS